MTKNKYNIGDRIRFKWQAWEQDELEEFEATICAIHSGNYYSQDPGNCTYIAITLNQKHGENELDCIYDEIYEDFILGLVNE